MYQLAHPRCLQRFLVLTLILLYPAVNYSATPAKQQSAAQLDKNVFISVTADKQVTLESNKQSLKIHDGAKSLLVNFKVNAHVRKAVVETRLVRLKDEDQEKDKLIHRFTKPLLIGNEFTVTMNSDLLDLTPGNYRFEFILNRKQRKTVSVVVKSQYPLARLQNFLKYRAGYNLLNKRLGGKLELYSSQEDNAQWAASNLNDGIPFKVVSDSKGSRFCTNCGWTSKPGGPAEVVFSFNNRQSATIDTIVIDTAAYTTIRHRSGIPKDVEIWASDTSYNKGFKKIHTARLLKVAAEQFIDLKPVRIKYLKLVFVNAYDDNFFRIAEIKALEHNSQQESILKNTQVNIADHATGTYLVQYTSDISAQSIRDLTDNKVSLYRGWASGKSSSGNASYLPQDFVFGFKDGKSVYLDSIVIDPRSGSPYYRTRNKKSAWVKKAAIYASAAHPYKNFRFVRTIELTQDAKEQTFKLDVDARYLKIRILENYGASYTSIGEIKLLEGNKPGYRSVMIEGYGIGKSEKQLANNLQQTRQHFKSDSEEKEPNNSFERSNPLQSQKSIRGTVKPLTDLDHFKLVQKPGSGQSSQITLTTRLKGLPYIATSLGLHDQNHKLVRKFDPSQSSEKSVILSWYLPRAPYYYKLRSVPASVVLIWDTSGSMGGRAKQVKLAVQKFIKNKPDDMRVNLVRFGNKSAEVLLGDFSHDRNKLINAIKGKFSPAGGTPMYDAIKAGVDMLTSKEGNRAIILLSDGADTESRLSHSEVIPFLKKHNVRIYTIGLGLELKIYLTRLMSTGKQILANIATITGGKSYFTPDPKELDRIYQEIAAELTQPPEYKLQSHISRGNGSLLLKATGERIPSVSSPTHIELIIDASGSMKTRMHFKRKIKIAKQVLNEVINDLPGSLNVALRVYGNRIMEGDAGDCQDSTLLSPFQRLDKNRLANKINSIRALGTTPIAYSLSKLRGDFKNIKGEKLVILLTDGKEECSGNPIQVVKELKREGLRFRLNIVGFSLKNKKLIRRMKALAQAGDGHYYAADNFRSLKKSLAEAMSVTYHVYDSSQKEITRGQIDKKPVSLPEGYYTVSLRTRNRVMKISNVCISVGKQSAIELKKEGEEVAVTRKLPVSAAPCRDL